MDSSARADRDDPFRFTTSPDRETDLFYRRLLRRVAEEVRRETEGGGLLSLILSGSLAMGEGCAYPLEKGGLQPGSDIDLYLVTAEKNVGELGARMIGFRERLLSALGASGLVVDLGVTSPDRLARLQPSVANCLLVRFGRTLAGDPETLRLARRPRFEEIPPRDGFLLLLNRTVEELAEFRTRAPRGAAERDFWYRFGKTVRDIGTSVLVAAGSFRPTLRERRDALPDRLIHEGIEERAPGLALDHTFWSLQKERPDIEEARRRYGGEGAFREVQARKRRYVGAVWEWERARVFGARPGAERGEATRAAESVRRRIGAWARFLGREGPRGLGPFARALARSLPATPLGANYEAAVLLLGASGPLVGEEETASDRERLAEAFRIAPARPRGAEGFPCRWLALRESVCGFWNREVMGSSRPPLPVEAP
ncbi:MAG: hypothetical protein ABIH26_09640 [Candidatus Eisenbacteria bacterium]